MSFAYLVSGSWQRRRQQTCTWIRASIRASTGLSIYVSALLSALTLACGTAHGQTSPAHGPLPKLITSKASPAVYEGRSATHTGSPEDSVVDDIPLADYLALLGKIAPAADTGAQSYMAAFQLRCGRALSTDELRRAVSQDNGDPVLMGFIRAAQVQDITAGQRLAERINCPRGGGR